MELPADLRWIEVDFPHMIAYKTEKLAQERPVCRLESIAADLSDIPARQTIFGRIDGEARKALIITEGVIAYLSSSDSALLSQDLFAVPSFQYWIQDYYQGGQSVGLRQRCVDVSRSPLSGLRSRTGWSFLKGRVGRSWRIAWPLKKRSGSKDRFLFFSRGA